MTKHLFLFTIGPVQSFIEQARKTQDLYAGSFLLSRLCEHAIKEFLISKEILNPKIIFPYCEKNSFPESIPNRFLAELECDDTSKLKEIGKNIEKSVKSLWQDINSSTFHEGYHTELFKNQVENILDIKWLFLEADINDYKKSNKEIEQIMGGIKNTRYFNQLEEKSGRKCSLCGERVAIFYKKSEDEDKKYPKNKVEELKNKKFIVEEARIFDSDRNKYKETLNEGEGLCGVCYTKRMLKEYKSFTITYNEKFPSVSEIALYNIYDKLKEENDIKQLRGGDYEPQDLFDLLNNNKKEKEVGENTQKIYKIIKEKKLTPTPYYAVIIFDGDNMGKWLSGEYLDDKTRLQEFQNELSKQLSEYADKSRKYLIDPFGKAVYAGGDDFLGFINLEYLFDVMEKLRDDFDKNIDFSKFGIKEKMTFSAGIVIAHYKTPLQKVLRKAREMEKKAKKMKREGKGVKIEKNAFGIGIIKHSGEINEFISRWSYEKDEKTIKILDVLKYISETMKKGDISPNYISVLTKEFLDFSNNKGESIVDKNIIKEEIKRLAKRSFRERKTDETKEIYEQSRKEIVAKIVQNITILYELREDFSKENSLENFIHGLHMIQFINRMAVIKCE